MSHPLALWHPTHVVVAYPALCTALVLNGTVWLARLVADAELPRTGCVSRVPRPR